MRYHYMDSMRSVLMLLGIVIHAAALFAPVPHSHSIAEPNPEKYFTALVWLIHVFRMPAFFTISGFFTHLLLKRYAVKKFLDMRFRRIFVPWAASSLALILPQMLILKRLDEGKWPNPGRFLAENLPGPWLKELGASHLWFLLSLVLYSVVIAALYLCFHKSPLVRRVASIGQRAARPAVGTALLLAALALYDPLADLFLEPLYRHLNDDLWFCFNVRRTVDCVPFFLFGILLYGNAPLERFFLKLNWGHFLVLFASMAILLLKNFVFSAQAAAAGVFAVELGVYCHALLVWLSVIFCFNFFMLLLNREHPFIRYMSDASYSIYLFHSVFVFCFAAVIIPLFLPVFVKFCLVCLGTVAVTLAIHHFLILRFDWLRLLFNGKRNKRKVAVAGS